MSVNSELRKLRLQRSGLQYLGEFYRQIEAEDNDRGAAILAMAALDKALEYAISRRLPAVHRPKIFERLFEENGALSTFDAKVDVAEGLGICGDLTCRNLRQIKHIRNTFAHAFVPVLFTTPAVQLACNVLELPPNPKTLYRALKFDTPREKYTFACEVTMVGLINYAAACLRIRADMMAPEEMVPVTPASLP